MNAAAIRRRLRGRDEGFTLLETVITISLITVIMTALASFFMTAIASTSEQRARQLAVQLADTALERLRSVDAADLLTGHGAGAAKAQFDAAAPGVAPWLASMTPAADSTRAAGTPIIPFTAVPAVLNGTRYETTTYLGYCSISATDPAGKCATSATNGVQYLRAVVAVTWPDQHCDTGTCRYLTATLISNTADPTFNSNQGPPPVPALNNPCGQTSVIGETVLYQLNVVAGTGVPTFSWALTGGALPDGLYLTGTGRVTGIPTVAGDFTATVQVRDLFGRQTEAACTWHVNPALALGTPLPDRTDPAGTAITPIQLAASGGSGPPYVFTASNLPTGVTLVGSTISGTPTVPWRYPATVTVTDGQGRTASKSFTWQVNPSPRTSTVGRPITPYQIGSATYKWTGGASLPAGLTMTANGLITGTPTTAGTSTVALTATDPTTKAAVPLTFRWSVVPGPSLTAPPPQVSAVNATVSLPVSFTCPNAPCSFTLAAGPTGPTISASGVISGKVGGPPQPFPAATVTIADRDGATASASFTWTVNPADLTVTGPGDQTATVGRAVSLALGGLVTGGKGPYSFTAVGLPPGLSIDLTTGTVTGTPTRAGSYPVIVTVARPTGSPATTQFTWKVQ